MHKIYQTLVEIWGNILGLHPEALSPSLPLTSVRFCDRGAAAIACEQAFHIVMQDEEVAGLKTMADWTEYIRLCIREQRQNAPAPTQAERDQWYYE